MKFGDLFTHYEWRAIFVAVNKRSGLTWVGWN